MKGWLVTAAGVSVAALAALSAQTPAPDAVLRAMHDELERDRKITVADLEAPYFIEYVMDEADTYSVSASLGGLVSKRRERFRQPEVHVRVGDYKFDNTNFTAGFGGMGGGTRYDLERFPLENSYPVLRRYLWLETDSAYKAAVEAISRKRAALRNLSQNGELNDFAHAEPIHSIHPFHALDVDENAWADKVRSLSAIFAEYPEVKSSSIELEASAGGYVVVNSEGTEVREPENVVYLRGRAIAQAADGATLRDAVTFHALDPMRMPPDAEMRRGITELAQNVVALAKAPKGEDYNGPVLFEGMAGPQIFAEVLGHNLSMTRRPVAGGGRGGNVEPSELDGRLGARVLPDSFSVVDDPTQKEWRGRPLFGSYDVDREGVTAKPLQLVEKGVLKSYLLTRQPVKGFEGSNGRARMPGSFGASTAAISNLFVSSTEGVAPADLKKQLIGLIQTRNKPYGILIRRMDFPSSATTSAEVGRMVQGGQGSGRPVSIPILAYKVYPDGREELVRGLRFRAFNARSLKDILAVGNDSTVFDFMDNSLPFALIGASSYSTEACVVGPSILIDDLELHPMEEDLPKLPVVPAPELIR